ncbi:Hypothetical protein Cp99MAT_1276 [Corynebacterium pseudotuberculosis]|nr:hypothetical protein CpCap1W_1261 [Corynebacterium pseudotuberculosis]AZN22185.1 Hypothetical protein CpOviAF1_1266 [Corynebacterium pseudotuberculosis]QBF71644.1 Hypothetical protein Cp99MAT_1276 [Corynebacterium pseudotuberculosis]
MQKLYLKDSEWKWTQCYGITFFAMKVGSFVKVAEVSNLKSNTSSIMGRWVLDKGDNILLT